MSLRMSLRKSLRKSLVINWISLRKKHGVLTKCSKYLLNINDVNKLYSLRVAKYNKNQFQTLESLKLIRKGLVMSKFIVWLC